MKKEIRDEFELNRGPFPSERTGQLLLCTVTFQGFESRLTKTLVLSFCVSDKLNQRRCLQPIPFFLSQSAVASIESCWSLTCPVFFLGGLHIPLCIMSGTLFGPIFLASKRPLVSYVLSLSHSHRHTPTHPYTLFSNG